MEPTCRIQRAIGFLIYIMTLRLSTAFTPPLSSVTHGSSIHRIRSRCEVDVLRRGTYSQHANQLGVRRNTRALSNMSARLREDDLPMETVEKVVEGDELNSSSRQPRPGSALWLRLRRGILKNSIHDKEIFALALPVLGAVLIDPCLSLVDTAWVGRLGALSLAAVGPCAALFNFVFATASCVLMVSTSVIVSKYKALENIEACGRTIVVASVLGILVGAIFAVLFTSYPIWFLKLMGAPDIILAEAIPYLHWRALAMPANMFLLVAGGAFRGIGDPTATLKNGALVGIVNAILDPILMFPLKLGTGGAAIATGIAQWLGALAYGRAMFMKRAELGLVPTPDEQGTIRKRSLIPKLRDIYEFGAAGSALMLRQIANVGVWTFMASSATRMGVLSIAAHSIMLSMWLVIGYFQEALGVSGQVLVSRSLNLAKETAGSISHAHVGNARGISKRVLHLSLSLGLFLSVLSQITTPWVVPIICKSEEVAKLVMHVYPRALLGFPICCVVWSWDSLYYGASDHWYNARTIAVASTVGAIGILLSTKLKWGLAGLWYSMVYFYFGIRIISSYLRFNNNKGPFGKSTAELKKLASQDNFQLAEEPLVIIP